MADLSENVRSLLREVALATHAGKAIWTSSQEEASDLYLTLGSGFVNVWKYGGEELRVAFLDENMVRRGPTWDIGLTDVDYDVIHNMYKEAQRKVIGLDELIEKMALDIHKDKLPTPRPAPDSDMPF